MKRTLLIVVALVALTGCTRAQIDAWLDWRANDPRAAHDWLHTPQGQAMTAPRSTPAPARSSDGRCVGMESSLAAHSPGWDVVRMSRIAYRESRCQPSASNSCCSGLLQIHYMHVGRSAPCGVYSRSDLYNAERNICAAALVWRAAGYGAWSTS